MCRLLFKESVSFLRIFFGLCVFTTVAYADFPGVKDPNLAKCIANSAEKHQWSKAEEVTALICHNKKISSVEGIDRYPNLEKLSLHKNRIDSFNLSGLSKLQVLNLGRNQLTELRLEVFPALEQLYVFGNNLTKLELYDLPALNLLKANNNLMTQLSYRNLPNIQKMHIFDNQLETIDIYNLPALIYMDCRQNPMPDPLYDEMDAMEDVTFHHDGNAEDW